MLFEKKNHFVLVNGVDPDEMKHYAVFNLGIHCLPKYRFRSNLNLSNTGVYKIS